MSCLADMAGRPAARPSKKDDEEDAQASPKVDIPAGVAASHDVQQNAEDASCDSARPGINN